MEIMNGSGCDAQVPMGTGLRNATIEDRLLARKQSLTRDLADVNAALDALQANPEVLKVLCLISKVNY
jgi:hypothetical protein